MTNFERWQQYTSGLISPQVYIDFGFYYMISAALQRRVWFGPDHMRLYPNQFMVFVGAPGIGKGLVLKKVAEVLRHHKLPNYRRITEENKAQITGVDRDVIEAVAQEEYHAAQQDAEFGTNGKKSAERPLLIPVAADATTYEALTAAICRAVRRKDYVEFDPKLQRSVTKIYSHSSICFCLEELSSLLRRHADDVVEFLKVGYDCGDYKKETKTQGVDRIQSCCINFLAGTQASFMQRTFTDGLLNEGFSSRALFLYAAKNRKIQLFIPDLTDEQKFAYEELLVHVGKLTNLYGRVHMSKETMDWMEDWWKTQQVSKVNTNEKLVHYYARKNIHAIKLAIAMHFAESLEMTISLEECQAAIAMLNKIEKVMHHALLHSEGNPLYKPSLQILAFLEETGGSTLKELLMKFWELVDQKQIEDILTHLITIGKVTTVGAKYLKVMEAAD